MLCNSQEKESERRCWVGSEVLPQRLRVSGGRGRGIMGVMGFVYWSCSGCGRRTGDRHTVSVCAFEDADEG